jgi:hypothetical protein
MGYLYATYTLFLVIGVFALWDRRKSINKARFITLVIVSPITELTVLIVSIPRLYSQRVRACLTLMGHVDSIAKRDEVRSKLGGLRIVE